MFCFFAPKVNCPAILAKICINKNAHNSHFCLAQNISVINSLQEIFIQKNKKELLLTELDKLITLENIVPIMNIVVKD